MYLWRFEIEYAVDDRGNGARCEWFHMCPPVNVAECIYNLQHHIPHAVRIDAHSTEWISGVVAFEGVKLYPRQHPKMSDRDAFNECCRRG